MLLIVMFESGTWRVRPAEHLTFGRAATCDVILPNEDRGVSRNAGNFSWRGDTWWLANSSGSSMLYLSGDLGFRADLPPGMALPLQQWHAKVRLDGTLASYTLRVRLPDLDESSDGADTHDVTGSDGTEDDGQPETTSLAAILERTVTSTSLRAPLNDTDKLVLAARFEEYLTWRHSGAALPRSAREAAARIGWEPHAVAKRCENIRSRYQRIGVPGLRGPRALEELAALLISTGELSGDDLRRLPPQGEPTVPPQGEPSLAPHGQLGVPTPGQPGVSPQGEPAPAPQGEPAATP